MKSERGFSLSIEAVVIIVVVLFVLIIVAGFFFGGFGRSATGIAGIGKGGEESASETDVGGKVSGIKGLWGESGSPGTNGNGGTNQQSKIYCCGTNTLTASFSTSECTANQFLGLVECCINSGSKYHSDPTTSGCDYSMYDVCQKECFERGYSNGAAVLNTDTPYCLCIA